MKTILGNILPLVLTGSNLSASCSMALPPVRQGVSISLTDLLLVGISHMEANGNSILHVTMGTIQSVAMALRNRVAGIAGLLTV